MMDRVIHSAASASTWARPWPAAPRANVRARRGPRPHAANLPWELHAHRIQPLNAGLLASASRTLREVFAGSLWADLGHGFVKEFLASFTRQSGGVGFVYLCGDRVVGFVVGADDARLHRASFLRRRWLALLLRIGGRLATRPHLAWRLRRYVHPYVCSILPRLARRPAVEEPGELPPASLILLGVTADHRCRGIAEHLTRAFLAELARRGARGVKLVVGADNAPALAFYRAQGWRESGCYPTPDGGAAYRLIYHLAPAPQRQAPVRP